MLHFTPLKKALEGPYKGEKGGGNQKTFDLFCLDFLDHVEALKLFVPL